jgi:simple sugar transport system permease protein
MKTEILQRQHGEVVGLTIVLAAVLVFFAVTTPRFLTLATFQSIAFQMPVLGLLTLAMLMPIVSGGFNLAVTFTANIAGLVMAWVLQSMGGPDAGVAAFALAVVAALTAGTLAGWVMGIVIAHTGAHPILVSLSMMIFLRGLGEFLTRGSDVSGFPAFVSKLGHGTVMGVPVPLLIFIACILLWQLLLTRTRLGFATYMVGSNPVAARYSGIDTRQTLTLIYTLSGLMCAIAGILMVTRFNSVRVGHGEAFLLITVLACFLGGVNPFGGFGRVVPVVLALIILQIISSGLNLLGANQHLATALWGAFLIAVMMARWLLWYLRGGRKI